MPKLSDAIDNAFSEALMLLLGGQVLLGFSFRICFEESLSSLPVLPNLRKWLRSA